MSMRASGLKAWAWQRLTAVYMAVFIVVALAAWLAAGPVDQAAWQALVARPAVAVASAVFVFSLLLHAWIGLRDVAIDYLRLPALRFTVLGLVALWLIALGLWTLMILGRPVP
jgi:succinate dehydrogenase / fumarate reductase membrane anchor subunit